MIYTLSSRSNDSQLKLKRQRRAAGEHPNPDDDDDDAEEEEDDDDAAAKHDVGDDGVRLSVFPGTKASDGDPRCYMPRPILDCENVS